ncbi:hypothetical protein [Acetivibrio straminisolvens]|uniref:Gingipain domain-containing protein n=1 Tax=Acetivibrio straminisolvens JCM 21531 TaxID=1294263 RepID=W4V9C2_9FIRM|nr:hypothetical protein [Acetivibrio straminisolvens]GAE89349.1 hypothetical protein JCM21531_2866 [Acetivibrio straminisolvens JCM 21531]
MKNSSSSLDLAYFKFTGTEFVWIGTKGSNMGKAEIYIDDVSQPLVDLYSPTTLYQQEIFKISNLEYGQHTVLIVVKNLKNSNSSGYNVNIDAFKYDSLTYVDGNNPRLTFYGNWRDVSDPNCYNGSTKVSDETFDFVAFSFIGTEFVWIGTKGSDMGKAEIYIDDQSYPSLIDLYSPTTLYQQEIFKVSGLPYGEHDILIVVRSHKNPNSTGRNISIDAFKYDSLAYVDGNDPSIDYYGDWIEDYNSNYYSGSTKISDEVYDFIYFTFTGTEFTWIGSKGSNMGKAEIIIDDISYPTLIDLYSPTTLYQQEIFKITDLEYGEHDILIAVRSHRNPNSTGNYVDIDAFICGTKPGKDMSIAEVDNGFLVVVADKIYSGYDYLKDAVHTYVYDTINLENYHTKIITVANSNDVLNLNADYICDTPDELKEVIRAYYNKGYEGFVLIGSHPFIPTAFVVANGDDAGTVYPSDLFYADMDDWGSPDSNGRYSEATASNLYKYAPEMFFGRISAGGSSNGNYYTESLKITEYLNKLHNFRINQGNLTPEQSSRTLVLKDDDWSVFKENTTMSKLGKEIYAIYDNSLSSSETLVSELQKGYKFIYECFHSNNVRHYIDEYPNDQHQVDTSFDYNVVRNINPKVNYINLFNCSSCKYINSNGNPMDNLGEAYLFDSDYVINVTGSYDTWGLLPDYQYWDQIAENEPIGVALRDLLTRESVNQNLYWYQLDMQRCALFGDPTAKYYVTQPTNRAPYIGTDLSASNYNPRINVKANTALNIYVYDSDSSSFSYEVNGLPAGSNISKSGNVIKWIPSSSDIGNVYTITIKLFNTDSSNNPINKYVETFTVRVTDNSLQQSPITMQRTDFAIDGQEGGFRKLPIIEELFRERSTRPE